MRRSFLLAAAVLAVCLPVLTYAQTLDDIIALTWS